jgi:SAM-dependent methyltransferase
LDERYCHSCGVWTGTDARTVWCGDCVSAWYEARRPRRFLDGCCGIGGISHGLAAAGHEVWGVDDNPRLRDDYLRSGAAHFVCADILEVLADHSFMSRFDFTAISPPCQSKSRMSSCRPGLAETYRNLIPDIRPLLMAWGGPWTIENVSGMRPWMINPLTLCMWGHFGREHYRHRLIEAGGGLVLSPPPAPGAALTKHLKPNAECGLPHPVATARAGHWKPGMFVSVAGHERKAPVRRVMEIDWARDRDAVKEAVPPYVGAWIAEQAELHLGRY